MFIRRLRDQSYFGPIDPSATEHDNLSITEYLNRYQTEHNIWILKTWFAIFDLNALLAISNSLIWIYS